MKHNTNDNNHDDTVKDSTKAGVSGATNDSSKPTADVNDTRNDLDNKKSSDGTANKSIDGITGINKNDGSKDDQAGVTSSKTDKHVLDNNNKQDEINTDLNGTSYDEVSCTLCVIILDVSLLLYSVMCWYSSCVDY
jgi:hypothetical protein